MTSEGVVPRTPVACGAIGAYDSSIVEAIAHACEPELRLVHRDRSSMLMLDREPLRWRSGLTRGLAWSEGTMSDAPVRSWQDAAQELNAAGLVVARGRRLVHSSVTGVAPVYHADCGEATYFASRLDPLVRALPMRFSANWATWSSILILGFPVEASTQFEEVRRLLAFTSVERVGAGSRVRQPSWPWAEVEPDLTLAKGVSELVERMREIVAGLPPGPIVSTLSGGSDSRLVTAFLAEARAGDLRALTLGDEDGRGWEEAIAAEVAAELAIPHEIVSAGDHDYGGRLARQIAGMEFSHTMALWLSPIAASLRSERGIVTDGLGADTLAQPGDRSVTSEMMEPDGSRKVTNALWQRLRYRAVRGNLPRLYPEPLRAALTDSSRRSLIAGTQRVRGHPAEATLSTWLTRSRAIAQLPHVLLGARCATVTPAADHRAAIAFLRIAPREKLGASVHPAVLRAVNPALERIPTTTNPTPELQRIRRRERPLAPFGRLAPDSLREHARLLGNGPLTPHLTPEFRELLSDPARLGNALRNSHLHHAACAVIALHLWHERYRELLREVDPGELMRG